jgi:hypothetical protein
MRWQQLSSHCGKKCDDSYTYSGGTHTSTTTYDELIDSVDPDPFYSDLNGDNLLQSDSSGRYGYKLSNQDTEYVINNRNFCSKKITRRTYEVAPSKSYEAGDIEDRSGDDWWTDFFFRFCGCSQSYLIKSNKTQRNISCSPGLEILSQGSLSGGSYDTEVDSFNSDTNGDTEQTIDQCRMSFFVESAQNAVNHKNPTRLFQLMQQKRWDLVYKRMRSHPHELRTWIYKSKEKGEGYISWAVLPIHAACIFGCPDLIMKAMIHLHPKSVTTGDSCWRLPIHLACHTCRSANTVRLLLQSSPPTINSADIFGHQCLTIALGSKGPEKAAILRLLDNGIIWQRAKRCGYRPPRITTRRAQEFVQTNKRCGILRRMNPFSGIHPLKRMRSLGLLPHQRKFA